MMFHMKQILVQVDDYTARLLDEVAPGRSRKRSKFIRDAVIRALLEVVDVKTRQAYERAGHERETWRFDPFEWAPESEAIHHPAARRSRARR